jgi:DNA-binding response OmpR family regulator
MASVLVFERGPETARLATQSLRGFGAGKVREVYKYDDAIAYARENPLDLIVADPEAAKGRALDFLRWLRRSDLDPNRFAPIILVAAQTPSSMIATLRSTGANFVIAKPYAAKTLLNRVEWVAKDKRPFVEAGAYVGPCRRISAAGLPLTKRGRRASDTDVVAQPLQAAG